ncbi:MAG: site-specific integrase [Oscillospiraceae bacterium]|nr:site-specific integrase [Oscillospiraceae bacterium]
MFFKELESGKVRYFEKFYNEKELKWRQVTVTMPSKNRAVQAEARRKLAQKIDSILNANKPQSNADFIEVFTEWQVIRKDELKASSFFNEGNFLESFKQRFEGAKLVTIHSDELQKFFSTAAITLCPQSMANLKCKVNLFFKFALKRGYITENPMNGVVIARRNFNEERLLQEMKKILTFDELLLVLGFVEEQRIALCLEFLFLSGVRVGELLAVLSEKYERKAEKLHIHHTLNYSGHRVKDRVLDTPKTYHSYRTISLDKRCIEILDFFESNKTDPRFIFTSENGKIISRDRLNNAFTGACAKILNLSLKESPTVHSLRHSHVSFLAELGVPIKTCIERMGHADEKMIIRIYCHVTPKMEIDLVQKINQKLTNAGA